jgi:hypothetical protein
VILKPPCACASPGLEDAEETAADGVSTVRIGAGVGVMTGGVRFTLAAEAVSVRRELFTAGGCGVGMIG